MNSQKYILIAKCINIRNRSETLDRFFTGTAEKARADAQKWRKRLMDKGYQSVRVEIWEVIATSYKGTVRS